MRRLLFILSLVFLATGCEKEISVDLPLPKDKIVVEGYIEPSRHAYVYLTKNAPYFAPTDLNTVKKYIIYNALVTISDGTNTDTLKEVTAGQGYQYKSTYMTGEVGKTYTLVIRAEGKELVATTTIPQPVPLDSVWFKPQAGLDSLGFVWARLNDPLNKGNAYRWFAQRDGMDKRYLSPLGPSVLDDRFINGKEFDFAISRGQEPNTQAAENFNIEKGFFKRGTTVKVKFCTIDAAAFEFFRSYESEVANNGNPFAAPTSIKSNISGDALGVWCGYGVWEYQLSIN